MKKWELLEALDEDTASGFGLGSSIAPGEGVSQPLGEGGAQQGSHGT